MSTLLPPSRLLALPPEIRNAILELILIQPNTTTTTASSTSTQHQHQNHLDLSPTILMTCRQLHAEGTPILYGQNRFQAHSSLLATHPSLLLEPSSNSRSTTHRLSRPITHVSVRSLIRRYRLLVRLDVDPRFTAAQATRDFSHVEELELDVFQAMFGSCDLAVLRLFEGVRGVGRARVLGSVGDGVYAAWLEGAMMCPVGGEVVPFGCEGEGAKEKREREGLTGVRERDPWTYGNR